jgi:uncharacterized protein YbbC (DUF1343 family)
MFLTILILFFTVSCKSDKSSNNSVLEQTITVQKNEELPKILPAADQPELYLPLLKGSNIGLVINQTSRKGEQHLLDFLLDEDVAVKRLFAPEHGFRGEADAGEKINTETDEKTGLKISSLYGKNKKPSSKDLEGIDLMVFDIQDVGVRFYTYLSTLHYVMEACAENNIPLIVLDRPNPNGHYVDGPLMQKEYMSFVGLHPVPVVTGMTIGEYAQMINGEGWLAEANKCELTVIPCKGYTHDSTYALPIKPSPNLPNAKSILLYPSLCFFEGTTFSVGRGTITPFQIYGHPQWKEATFNFTPRPKSGAKYPKHKDKKCGGVKVMHSREELKKEAKLDLSYILKAYQISVSEGFEFFNDNNFFEKLVGTNQLRRQLEEGVPEEQIRRSWEEDLEAFKKVRSLYLLY